jgi:VIT1/CCC1 family predicted Fe2+/Mn2+ transporter
MTHAPPPADRDPGAVPHLREAVLGAIDGTVTTFAIVAGVAGAGLPIGVVLALGTANVVADGFSMAAGIYAGGHANLEDTARRRAWFTALVARDPDAARARLTRLLATRGLSGEALEQATEAIRQSRSAWIGLLVDGNDAPSAPSPARDAAATFLAFLSCGMLPLVPFALGLPNPFATSVLATAVTFAGIGALRSRWSLRRWWISAAETLLIGGAAALIAYGVGRLFESG